MMNTANKSMPIRSALIATMLAVITVTVACKGKQASNHPGQNNRSQASERLKIAMEKYQEHCKSAGEKIYKTVDNVDGIFLMKVRPKEKNFEDQFAMTDPYGNDLGGDGYIESFLKGSDAANNKGARSLGSPPRTGYDYVEAVDPKDGVRYRYTGHLEEPWQKDKRYLKGYMQFVVERQKTNDAMPRYGVTYEDISTHEDREYWIAGSALKVIDLKNNEVIAERIGYMIDLGQGNKSGGRSPWLLAADNACPSFHKNLLSPTKGPGAASQARQTEDFVEKVLRSTSN